MKVSELFEAFDRYEITDINALPNANKDHNIDDIVSIISANCKDMLKAVQKSGVPVVRGLRHSGNKVKAVMTAIRPDRLPMEMPGNEHDFLEALFTEVGLKANRTNSIFVHLV